MDIEKKIELVKRNTAEILTEEELRQLMETKAHPVAYDGITVTGPFHMGYLIPFSKMLDFHKAGIKNIVLIADIHSALDDLKAPWEELEKRSEYYKKCIELSFPWDERPDFVSGSSFQLKKEYVMDVFKIAALATVNRTTRAASEVCRMKNPKVSELVYPIMQSVDEEYLKVDIQLGGIDQRHIFGFAREYLPRIGYKPRVEVMTPLVASLKGPGTKMCASVPASSIKVYDSEEQIKGKVSKAYCPVGDVKDNPVIQLCRFVVFPVKGKLKVERPEKFGGDITFESFEELEKSFIDKSLHPADLKNSLSKELIDIFSGVRKYFEKNRDILEGLGKDFL